MSDELRGRGISVTIKYGKGYEETWANFTGTPEEVRKDIIAYFGESCVSDANGNAEDLSLNELVIKATQIAHGIGLVASHLGGIPLPSGNGPSGKGGADDGPPWDEPAKAGDDPWAAAGEKATSAPADPNAHLYADVEAATDVDALKRLWAENQAAFADEKLMAAYKAKGKALKAAAS